MPTALLGLLPSLIGGLGLIQGSNQSAEANNQRQAGVTALNDQNAIYGEDQALAGMVPQTNAAGMQAAELHGNNLLNSSLSQTAGRFAAGGGSPTGDTAFNFSALNDANRVTDPLKLYEAQTAVNQPQQQADILSQSKPGSLSSGYFQSSNMAQPPPSSFQASLAQLAQGLGAMNTAPGSGLGGVINDANTADAAGPQGGFGGAPDPNAFGQINGIQIPGAPVTNLASAFVGPY